MHLLYNLINSGHKKLLYVLKKGPDFNNLNRNFPAFSEIIKKNLRKSETYACFTKITTTTWSINKIIPVSIKNLVKIENKNAPL